MPTVTTESSLSRRRTDKAGVWRYDAAEVERLAAARGLADTRRECQIAAHAF
jgi:hypothetical protein